MSISFGSTGIKPYAGSKEVKEAYVGSQKIYSAAPAYVYAFIGGENDYVVAPWTTLGRYAVIKKINGIYRISITGGDSYAQPGQITLDITSIQNKTKITFIYQANVDSARVLLRGGSPVTSNLTTSGTLTGWTNQEIGIPTGTTTITFSAHNQDDTVGRSFNLDSIRIE